MQVLRTCLILGCLILLAGFGGGPQACAEKPPNIVYILADDLGYGDVSCLNEQCVWSTPNIDRLAGEGIRFTDAHSGSAVCTPTRYGILTGRYAWRSRLKRGVLHGDSPHLIDPERMTVASFLKKHGYHTGVIGKWHLGWDFANQSADPQQIDFSKPVENGPPVYGFDYSYCHNGSLDMAPYVYVENGQITAAPDRTTENKDYQAYWHKGLTGADFDHTDVLPNFTRHAVEYLRTHGRNSKPFFLYLPLPAPHTPILPLPEFQGKSHTNAYGDFVLQVDD
ncbi:MAG: sulfatase-like hydrolase/transferase, partial [Pirellulales bacterium]